MRRNRFADEQIVAILQEAERTGKSVAVRRRRRKRVAVARVDVAGAKQPNEHWAMEGLAPADHGGQRAGVP